MRVAERVRTLPPYLFAELDRKVSAKRASGADVISLGVGDPDLPTPRHVVEALQEAVEDPATHQYPSYYGLPAFRVAVAEWYGRRFGVAIDPDTEVQPLIGSKEGLVHLTWAFVDPGTRPWSPTPAIRSTGWGPCWPGDGRSPWGCARRRGSPRTCRPSAPPSGLRSCG